MSTNYALVLPLQPEPGRLKHDLAICENSTWQNHFNQHDYSGNWTSISLRSATGKETDILAHTVENFSDTELLKKCAYFKEILNHLKCEKESVRLLCLAPGSEIKEHSDPHLGYEFGWFRLHIPIVTDQKVEFYVNGNSIKMQPGECWYANFHLPHSVKHKGSVNRVHLVIDCIRNDWSDALFAAAGYDFEEERKAKLPDTETLQRIIAELALQNTETALQLKADLEKTLPNP